MNIRRTAGDDSLRIWRSPYSNFYKDETLHASDVYTEDHLRELAGAGFNAVWIHAYLRDVAPTKVFPELGLNSAAHLRSLRTVIRRGERAGIRVFVYMQPPMGMPARAAFWRSHPEARGVTKGKGAKATSAMCTSEPSVRAFLHQAAETLSRRLPGLGGAILITASEYLAHCYSHYATNPDFKYFPDQPEMLGCPRCAQRQPKDVIVDVVGGIHGGFKAAGNGAEVIAWNWSWSMYEKEPQQQIVDALPGDVILMAGFERGGSKVILGKRRVIDEYALSYAGPSERFVGSLKAARRRGMRTLAKLQIGTTHELGVAPNLPVIGTLYEKARAMRRLGSTSYMGCWNFGNMLTANTAAFTSFLTAKRLPPRAQALRGFARAYFPGCDAEEVVAGWELFADAMDHYPFCIPFLYKAPLTFAVAYPIEPGPLGEGDIGASWHPMKRGDELSGTFGPYTLGAIIKGLGALTRIWWQGVRRFENGVAGCEAPAAQEEVNAARMAGHCFHSGWNLYRAYRLRKTWAPSRLNSLRAIMRDELGHLPDAHRIARRDRRMGFHSSSGFPSRPQQHLFTAEGIRRKIRRLEQLVCG
jgi:hypothetical protein